MNAEEIINFWFKELTFKDWYQGGEEIDFLIKSRFLDIHHKAANGELFTWRNTPLGRLAEIIVLDQFSRNIFRNTEKAFAFDAIALILAQEAISLKMDEKLEAMEKHFLYIPYMHSESKLIHEEAVRLYSQSGLESGLDFELKHKVIIDKFGRYPHRNEILKRDSTQEELEFLKTPGSSF